MLRSLVTLVLVGLGACAGLGSDDGANSSDAGTSSDGGSPSCGTVISFDPSFELEASSIAPIRAIVTVLDSQGVLTYAWSITHDNASVPYTQEASDNSQIGFIAADPGPYYVSVAITGATSCPYANATANVGVPGANTDVYRLRAVPPANSGAPPQEQVIQVRGGADYARDITLDQGLSAVGSVRSGTASGPTTPAYVKFMPVSTPNAFTELFTGASGNYATRLLGVTHDVLVIPTSTALAPKLLQWTPTTTSLVVTGGTLVTGTVRNPAGTGLAGAKVQLLSNGVPSTLATTAADGTFSLRASFVASAMITVKVTPPVSSGLPRLEASGAFTLTTAMQINYAAGLTTCNLQNTPVRRNTVNQANAKVTVVGSLAAIAGTVTAGAAANALGTVRVAASAGGGGLLPSLLVPRASTLSAVVQLGAQDFAIDALDTSACSVAAIDAAPLATVNGIAKNPANAVLGGVRVEATPVGLLALADAQLISVTTNSAGAFALPLAAGGHYDVRFLDPYARVARREETDITSVSVPTSATLPLALVMSGKVRISGSSQPLPGTSVQLLCAQCAGVDATRPVAETATNTLSDYRIAVPDPGTM